MSDQTKTNNTTTFDDLVSQLESRLNNTIKPVQPVKATKPKPVKTTKQKMLEHVAKGKKAQAKKEVKILKQDDMLKIDLQKQIDKDIVEYLRLKKELTDLGKVKTNLEKKLDAMATSSKDKNSPDKKTRAVLSGLKYGYVFEIEGYDKVVSKAELLDLGLWDEFIKRGLVSQATRKKRSVVETGGLK